MVTRMTVLNNLIGKKISRISGSDSVSISLQNISNPKVESPLSLIVEDYTLNIYNPFTIKGTDTNTSMRILEGHHIVSCREQSDMINIVLNDNIEITIDLRDESFKGPEALSLYGPNNLIVVWN